MAAFDANESLTPFREGLGYGAILFDRTRMRQAEASWFDPDHWGSHAQPVSSGGRGAAWFVDGPFGGAVLRHYLRGGLAEDGTRVIDPEAIAVLGIRNSTLDAIGERETAELRRRVSLYRGDRPPVEVAGRTVIVVDDGVATGVTDLAALRALRRRNTRRLVLAVPVCPPETARLLREDADEVVCLQAPPRY